MPTAQRQRPRVVPGYCPCAACEKPMDYNAVYCFCQGVQCICTTCYDTLGFRFTADGAVVRVLEA